MPRPRRLQATPQSKQMCAHGLTNLQAPRRVFCPRGTNSGASSKVGRQCWEATSAATCMMHQRACAGHGAYAFEQRALPQDCSSSRGWKCIADACSTLSVAKLRAAKASEEPTPSQRQRIHDVLAGGLTKKRGHCTKGPQRLLAKSKKVLPAPQTSLHQTAATCRCKKQKGGTSRAANS